MSAESRPADLDLDFKERAPRSVYIYIYIYICNLVVVMSLLSLEIWGEREREREMYISRLAVGWEWNNGCQAGSGMRSSLLGRGGGLNAVWTGCSVGLAMKEEDGRGDGFRWMVVGIMLLACFHGSRLGAG